MGLTCQAAQRYLEKNDLAYSYAADTRAALGVPHALYNCIASFQLPLRLEPQARFHSFAKQLDHEIRESLTPERRLFRMAEQMGWYIRFSGRRPRSRSRSVCSRWAST